MLLDARCHVRVRLLRGLPLLLALLLGCTTASAPPGAPAGSASAPAPTVAAPASTTGASGEPAPAGGAAAAPTPLAPRAVKAAYPSAALSQMEFMFAVDQGIYARLGVAVEGIIMTTAPAVAALVNGDLQYVYAGSTLLLTAARGLPVRTIFQGSKGPTMHLFAHPRISSFEDLRGQTISVLSAGGLSREVVELLLEQHGVDPRAVNYLASGTAPAQMEHLRQGLAAAASIAPPWPLVAQREGYRLLANLSDELEYPFGLFATTTARLADEPDEVRALVRGTLDTQRLMRDDPEATIDWIQRRFEVERDVAAESYALVIRAQNADGIVSRSAVANYLRVQTDQPELRDARYEDLVDLRPLTAVQTELQSR